MPIRAAQAANRLREAGELGPVLEDILQQGGRIIGERAVNEYMRDTGPTDRPNRQMGPGSLRVQRGRLARSLLQTRGTISGSGGAPESIARIEADNEGGKLVKGSRVPYAAAHEFGLSTTVQVQAHTRTITEAFGNPLPSGPQEVQVQAHSRNMDMPERPYLRPALDDTAQRVTDLASERIVEAFLESGL